MENKKLDLNKIYQGMDIVGTLQTLPVFVTCLLSIFATFASMSEIRSNPLKIIDTILFFSGTLGLISGLISSYLLYNAKKNRDFKQLNQGILFNTIAWALCSIIIFSLALSFFYYDAIR